MKTTASIPYPGLDVHKDSIDIAVAEGERDSEVRHVGQIGGDRAALDKALRRLISRGSTLHVVYEAGRAGSSSRDQDRPARRDEAGPPVVIERPDPGARA